MKYDDAVGKINQQYRVLNTTASPHRRVEDCQSCHQDVLVFWQRLTALWERIHLASWSQWTGTEKPENRAHNCKTTIPQLGLTSVNVLTRTMEQDIWKQDFPGIPVWWSSDNNSHPQSEQIGQDIKEWAWGVNTAAKIAEHSELVFKISHCLFASLLEPLASLLPLPSAPSNLIRCLWKAPPWGTRFRHTLWERA